MVGQHLSNAGIALGKAQEHAYQHHSLIAAGIVMLNLATAEL